MGHIPIPHLPPFSNVQSPFSYNPGSVNITLPQISAHSFMLKPILNTFRHPSTLHKAFCIHFIQCFTTIQKQQWRFSPLKYLTLQLQRKLAVKRKTLYWFQIHETFMLLMTNFNWLNIGKWHNDPLSSPNHSSYWFCLTSHVCIPSWNQSHASEWKWVSQDHNQTVAHLETKIIKCHVKILD